MDFVIIANDWGAGVRNPTSKHRIAEGLARRGHRVLWLSGAGMRRPALGSAPDRGRILRRVVQGVRRPRRVWPAAGTDGPEARGGIWVASPLLIPLASSRAVRALNGRWFAAVARRWTKRLGFDDVALINYVPVLCEAMHFAVPRAPDTGQSTARRDSRIIKSSNHRIISTVYHCVDLWSGFKMYDSALMAECDARSCRYADAVIASSRALYEHCRPLNPNTRLIMHGVDHAHFASALTADERPDDMPAGPVVGFFGLLSEWLDQDLLAALAGRLQADVPDARIVLIGREDVSVDRIDARPNIVRLGPRDFRDLPCYAACFSVGIIPFVVNELTHAVNPIKLREMLAAGCPVVSTALPEVTRFAATREGLPPHAVAVGESHDRFIQQVCRCLESPLDQDARRAISCSVSDETWAAKVEEILAVVRRCGALENGAT